MRHVDPYLTERGLLTALDNGGRFYNLFTKAGDHRISRAELARVAHAPGSTQQAVLYFEMAQVGLPETVRARAEAALDPRAREDYRAYRPAHLPPSRIDIDGQPDQAVVVEGVPRFLRDRSRFTGMMMLPVSPSGTTTFTMIPLYDQFHVYELFDDRRLRRPCCIVASARNVDLPEDAPVRFGGVLKPLEAENEAERRHHLYLEAAYYTKLSR